MDHTGILIDTSIVIEYLRKDRKEKTRLYTLCKAYKTVFISSITVFEVFVGLNPKNEKDVRRLFNGFVVLAFDDKTAKLASQEYQRLRTQNKLIEIKDLFIGATAITHGLPLATLNIEHFKRLNNLQLIP